MLYHHTPVMVKEVLQYLDPQPNKNYIDCTLGLGGHAAKILERTKPNGKLLGIEQDPESLNKAENNLKKYRNRITFVSNNFRYLREIIRNSNFSSVSGIFFDLGLSSWQIESPEKGLSFSFDSYLDMRLSPDLKITAADILDNYSEKQLANLFFQYGDMKKNRNLARKIVASRREKSIQTTRDLIEIVGSTNPKVLAPIFQALRIEVNQELENLSVVLPQALEILPSRGRLVVISYHSGEDRTVKNFFRSHKNEINILTKKPVVPSQDEIQANPRSRSAKLRAGEKIY